jgi:hypothetical protein
MSQTLNFSEPTYGWFRGSLPCGAAMNLSLRCFLRASRWGMGLSLICLPKKCEMRILTQELHQNVERVSPQ